MTIHLKYVKENHEHQKVLDTAFNGKIVVVDHYVNQRAIIKYGCVVCGTIFYQKPEYLLNPDNEHNHFCIVEKESRRKPNRKKIGKIPEELNEILALFDQGVSASEISRRLGISRDKTRYWLNKMRAK